MKNGFSLLTTVALLIALAFPTSTEQRRREIEDLMNEVWED